MNKITTFIFTCLLFSTVATLGQKHLIGVKMIGMSTSVSSSNYDAELGWGGGFTYTHKMSNRIHLGGEVLFEQRRISNKMNIANIKGTVLENKKVIHRLNYVSVPLTVNFIWGEKLFGGVGIGVAPTFLLSANYDRYISKADNSIEVDGTVDSKSKAKSFNLGMLIDAGMGYQLNEKFSITGNFRYNMNEVDYKPLSIKGVDLRPVHFAVGVRYLWK